MPLRMGFLTVLAKVGWSKGRDGCDQLLVTQFPCLHHKPVLFTPILFWLKPRLRADRWAGQGLEPTNKKEGLELRFTGSKHTLQAQQAAGPACPGPA